MQNFYAYLQEVKACLRKINTLLPSHQVALQAAQAFDNFQESLHLFLQQQQQVHARLLRQIADASHEREQSQRKSRSVINYLEETLNQLSQKNSQNEQLHKLLEVKQQSTSQVNPQVDCHAQTVSQHLGLDPVFAISLCHFQCFKKKNQEILDTLPGFTEEASWQCQSDTANINFTFEEDCSFRQVHPQSRNNIQQKQSCKQSVRSKILSQSVLGKEVSKQIDSAFGLAWSGISSTLRGLDSWVVKTVKSRTRK